jgi:hypothetical protein
MLKVIFIYRVDKMPLLSLKTVDDGEQVIVYNHQGNAYCTVLYILFKGTVARVGFWPFLPTYLNCRMNYEFK